MVINYKSYTSLINLEGMHVVVSSRLFVRMSLLVNVHHRKLKLEPLHTHALTHIPVEFPGLEGGGAKTFVSKACAQNF